MTGTFHQLPPCDPDRCVFYVTAQRDRQVALASGPYADGHAAVAAIERVIRTCEDLDPWTAFDAFAVVRVEHHGGPSKLGRLERYGATLGGLLS